MRSTRPGGRTGARAQPERARRPAMDGVVKGTQPRIRARPLLLQVRRDAVEGGGGLGEVLFDVRGGPGSWLRAGFRAFVDLAIVVHRVAVHVGGPSQETRGRALLVLRAHVIIPLFLLSPG